MREIRPKGQGETPGNYLLSRSGELTYLGLDRIDDAWQKLEGAVERAIAEPAPATAGTAPRTLPAAPALSLPTLQGQPVNITDFAGKPLVGNFFTTDTCDWTGAALEISTRTTRRAASR